MLTDSDKQKAATVGVPIRGEGDLWVSAKDGGLVLTVKGIAFLKEVSRVHEVPIAVREVTSERALHDFRYRVTLAQEEAAKRKCKQRLEDGLTPLKSRALHAAFAYGSDDDVLQASRVAAVVAGVSNAVALPTKKRAAKGGAR